MIRRVWAKLDSYVLMLIATVALASILPLPEALRAGIAVCAKAGIALLFFLHGARLSRNAVIEGVKHWRLHLAVAGITFALFPILGLALRALPGLDPALADGMLYLTLLPSTVQSSVGLVAIARGNVAGAVCSATFSNLAGIFVTPILVFLTISGARHAVSLDSAGTIVGLLLLPFIAGHLLRPLIGSWITARKALLGTVDRGSILLVVFSAFSAAVAEGLWRRTSATDLIVLLILCISLLASVLVLSALLGRTLGFSREDRITLQFCGSKKSMASGVPMAGVLFAAPQIGAMLLPLMMFHQIQLIVCSVLARRYAEKTEEGGATDIYGSLRSKAAS